MPVQFPFNIHFSLMTNKYSSTNVNKLSSNNIEVDQHRNNIILNL